MTTLTQPIRGQVTSIDEVQGVLSGYLALWGTPQLQDAYNTHFSKSEPPEMALDLLPFALCYEHGQDAAIGKEIIGRVTKINFDDKGIAFEGQLDRSSPYFSRVVTEILDHQLATSSSTAEHTAEFDTDGRFKTWILHELSLTASPAEERMPPVTLVRSVEPTRDALEDPRADTPTIEQVDPQGLIDMDFANMSPQEILTLIASTLGISEEELLAQLQQTAVPAPEAEMALSAPDGAAVPAPAAPAPVAPIAPDGNGNGQTADILTQLQQLIAQAQQPQRSAPQVQQQLAVNQLRALISAPPVPAPRPAVQPRQAPAVITEPRNLWSKSLSDLMLVHNVMRSRGRSLSDPFMLALAKRAESAFKKDDPYLSEPHVRSLMPYTRADEIVTSTNSGNGDEWIGVAYSNELWEKARHNVIYQALVAKGMRVEEVPQGYESVVILTEGSDPTVYTITQSADLDATLRPTVIVPITPPTTGQVTLTPGYLGMAVAYTSVFEEDSLVPAASQLNKQMQAKAEETIEQLMINGDSATSGNVNFDGGTPTTQYYMASASGFRKYALVTGSGTSVDGGTIDEDDFIATFGLLPGEIQAKMEDLAFIVNPGVYLKAMQILALKTQDVNGTNATLTTGKIDQMWGIDVLRSGFLPLTDTDGKVTFNAAGTKGSILAVYAPFWAMGWKRRVTFETDKDILAQTNLIVATFRAGLLPRGAGASTISYNLTV